MAIIEDKIDKILSIDILEKAPTEDNLVGRPFYIDYSKALVLISDAWKHRVGGIPQGSFLLAFYKGDAETGTNEALLLRAIGPTKLPTDNDVISSMIEYYKDDLDIAGRDGSGKNSKLDTFTRYEFSFSGLECRILGTFYRANEDGKDFIEFGADVENFYSANNYVIYKAKGEVLKYIVNLRSRNEIAGSQYDFKVGKVRYSSSRRFQQQQDDVEVFISPKDFLGKRTALFGMTRTGKSNTIKKVIEATQEISSKSTEKVLPTEVSKNTSQFDGSAPRYNVGQIIFDINGEYANPNLQDDGTAIFELYKDSVIRYSVIDKTSEGFKVLKINFYRDIQSGFELIKSKLLEDKAAGDYIKSFTAMDLSIPENYEKSIQEKTSDERNAAIAYDRKKALFMCCLSQAGFTVPGNIGKVKFMGDKDTINLLSTSLSPHEGLTIEEATQWFTTMYEGMGSDTIVEYKKQEIPSKQLFDEYKKNKGKEFFDEDMKSMLVMLTRKSKPTSESATLSGFRKLIPLRELHTPASDKSFEIEIAEALREGKIIIVDLSQGNPDIQRLYSERICTRVFAESMERFINNLPNNFIQFYFEEAHNLFPKKDDKDLSQIYNRIAKEGAKLNIGMIYATQEVSTISANILKNTQNWFIAHLNNEEELKELRKYYDFNDFADSLIRFSSDSDKGFIRMKTYTNPFVVPVQIDRFLAK